jgi:hypothetical protein
VLLPFVIATEVLGACDHCRMEDRCHRSPASLSGGAGAAVG